MLIELKDGYIEEVISDTDSTPGCETCDYGSEYINEFDIEMKTVDIHVEINEMYEYAISEDYMMKLFLNNVEQIREMKESEFVEWLKEKVNKEASSEFGEGEDKFEVHPK